MKKNRKLDRKNRDININNNQNIITINQNQLKRNRIHKVKTDIKQMDLSNQIRQLEKH